MNLCELPPWSRLVWRYLEAHPLLAWDEWLAARWTGLNRRHVKEGYAALVRLGWIVTMEKAG